jgi:hypothetical protein
MLASLHSGKPRTKTPFWRLFVAGLMALVLVVQGYSLQTHLHKEFGSATVTLNTGGSTGHHKIPVNDDPASCPTCQQILHAGQFVAPAWLLPLLVNVAVSRVEIVTAAIPHYDTVSHSWRGRGPPLH